MHTNAQQSLARIEAMLGEPLREFLFEQYHWQGLSFREIALWLSEQGKAVSHCTLYRWYHRLCGTPRSLTDAMRNKEMPTDCYHRSPPISQRFP